MTPVPAFESLHLKARWLGCQRIALTSCVSTNDEAARLARAGAKHGTIIIADHQSSGRGRDGRVWESPPGGLYLSAVLRPQLPLSAVPPITLAIGIGVCDAVRTQGAPAVLKWPNDVLVYDRKLAGVLVEAQSQGNRLDSVVIGIGINVRGELDVPSAITLTAAAGIAVNRELFIETLLAHVERWVDRFVALGVEAIIPAWQERMAHGLAARATIDGEAMMGTMAGLDLDGALLLRDHAGRVHRVRSGDVEVLRSVL